MLTCHNFLLKRGLFQLQGSFSLKRGERVALKSPSGSGKSSLLLALAGFVPFEQGEVGFEQQDLLTLLPEKRPISILFQEHNLFDHLTLHENIKLMCGGNFTKFQERVDHYVTLLDIGSCLHQKTSNMSGGEQQRAGFLRCLLQERPIILLDEPFNGLDQERKHVLITLLKRLENTAILFTSHSDEDIQSLATRKITIKNNVLV